MTKRKLRPIALLPLFIVIVAFLAISLFTIQGLIAFSGDNRSQAAGSRPSRPPAPKQPNAPLRMPKYF